MTKAEFEDLHKKDHCWLCELAGVIHPSEETAHLVEGSRRREGFYARLCKPIHRTNKLLSIHGCYGRWMRPLLMREFLKRYPDQTTNLKKMWPEMYQEIGGASLPGQRR